MENKKNQLRILRIQISKNVKTWLISEYWRAQGIYENLRTKNTPTGSTKDFLQTYFLNSLIINTFFVL